MLKRESVRGVVISNTCVKLYQHFIINEVARVMIKGEHTYVCTYGRTHGIDPISHPQLPLCEGITRLTFSSLLAISDIYSIKGKNLLAFSVIRVWA